MRDTIIKEKIITRFIHTAPATSIGMGVLSIRENGESFNDIHYYNEFIVDNMGRIYIFDGGEHDYLNDPENLILVPWNIMARHCKKWGFNPKTIKKIIFKLAKELRDTNYWEHTCDGPLGWDYDPLHGNVPDRVVTHF